MALAVTTRTRQALDKITIKPILVARFDGVPTLFGAGIVKKTVKVGDPGLLIGNDWKIGGLVEIEDQSDILDIQASTNMISQQLNPDKGNIQSISSMLLALDDFNNEATRLVTPGEILDDIQGVRCQVFLGFEGGGFPQDYIRLFTGIVDENYSDPGTVFINLSHPDNKKRSELFLKRTAKLTSPMTNSQTFANVDSTEGFATHSVTGPNGLIDTATEKHYVRINDEIMEYTGTTATSFTGLTRGQLTSVAAAHATGDSVDSFYRLIGNSMDLALKLMLSGRNGPYLTSVEIDSFVKVSGTESVDNAIFFLGIDLVSEHNIVLGDYIRTSGASNGSNNFSTYRRIETIEVTDLGTYCVVDGAALVFEVDSPAIADFRSQYDTLSSGLMMFNDEVDIQEHIRLKDLFLSNHNYDFYLKDTIKGRDFLDVEIYKPASSWSVPRKSRSSVAYMSGPIPGTDVVTLSNENIVNGSKLKMRRSTSKNFFNTVVFKFDQDALEDKFIGGAIKISTESLNQIKNIGVRAFVVESSGMRTTLGAQAQALAASNRRIKRFRFGAEYIEEVEVMLHDAFAIEINDVVILDGRELNMIDIKTGTRGMEPRLFEVTNKKFNWRTGQVFLTLIDTAFDADSRYGLISPASEIKSGLSTSQFVIQSGPYSDSKFGANEFKKWQRYLDVSIKVRSPDSVTRNSHPGVHTITSYSGNTITVTPAFSFTPQPGDIMELSTYNNATEQVKLIYGWMRDTNFSDGKTQFLML